MRMALRSAFDNGQHRGLRVGIDILLAHHREGLSLELQVVVLVGDVAAVIVERLFIQEIGQSQ